MAVECVTSIATKIGEYLVAPIGRQIGYVLFYDSNVGDFKNQVKELENKRVEVQGRATEAERNGDAILPSVKSWLEKVEKIKQVSSGLDGEFQVTKRCFNVPYPSLKSRYQGSKKAKKNTADARDLEQSGNFERVSCSTPPSATRFKSTEEAKDFESRRRTFKEIKEAIEDAQISMIGIYGMGGVGKTVLVKEVVKQTRSQFEEVVMAVVSRPVNLERIQQQIAEMLGVKFEKESDLGRAERLNERLMQKKKVLVILDDIWEPVNLGAIGIPFGAEHKGCKIVLTCRSKDVCNQMDIKRNIQVGVLLKPEARDLFQKMAGNCVNAPQINPLAYKIVKRCSGLPLAIVTVARALKDKPLSTWKDAANRRRISKEVFSALQLSFDCLESDEAKLIFLLCCIYGEDHNIAIEDLWKYGFSLGLFQEVYTEEAARNRAFALAEILKYSCLLQEGRDGDCVKMHDVVRDFAISVASKEYGFLVRSNFPESFEYQRYTRISIISDAFHIFRGRLECPNLQFLYLECSHPSLKVPDDFFSGMKLLKVLVMSRMHFLSLPPSLVDLGNLQTLCLDNCRLKDVSIIGTLKELKFLSFIGSDLEELPKEIGELIHLKLLDLSDCGRLKIFPHDVLVRLSQLEGLYMGASFSFFRLGFTAWEVERRDKERRNVSLRDLKHMSRLTSIPITVPDEDCLPDDGDSLFNNLLRFQIGIGSYFLPRNHFLYSRALTLESLRIPLKLLSIPLKTAEYLHLKQIRGLENILYDLSRLNLKQIRGLDREGVLNLKCLTVEDTRKVEYIFNAKASVSPATSSSLVKLDLSRLPDLKAIYHGHLPSEFFVKLQELKLFGLPALINIWNEPATHACLRNLRVLIVQKCNGLKNLFPHFTAEDLSELVELRVESCEIMEVIFQKEVEEAASTMNDIEFPHLQILELKSLPKLKKFYSKMKCSDTDTKEPLFSKKVAFPTLEKLIISKVGDVKEIWHHQIPDKSFFQLKTLQVDGCHQLQNVIPFHMLTRLHNLEQLSIENCDSVKEVVKAIISNQGGDKESCFEIVVFPRLHTLILQALPSLDCFYQIPCHAKEANNLHDLRQPLPLFGEKVIFPVLKELVIHGVHNLKEMWHPQIPANSFSQLNVLKVQGCHQMLNVVPFHVLRMAQSLKEITVLDCDSMEEIVVEPEGLVAAERHVNGFLFTQLRILRLWKLPRLKHIMYWDKYPLGTLGFQSVISIDISECNSLKSLFPPSIANSLVQLQFITIDSCDLLETIIAKEREGEENFLGIIMFPKLNHLTLNSLPNFMSFHTQLNWSSLQVLEIAGCPAMKTFISSTPCPQKLKTGVDGLKEAPKKGNLCSSQRPFFDNKVALTSLTSLRIEDLDSTQQIFDNQHPDEFLSRLENLSVDNCDKLLRVVPSYLLPRLRNLYALTIRYCESVEEILEGVGEKQATTISFTKLKELELYDLPNLRIFCSGNYTLNFSSLNSVKMDNCPEMQTFSSELISAPKLERVEEDGEYLWEGDLNTTIKRIFHEKNMSGVGSVSDDSSHNLDSEQGNDIFNGGLVMENLQFPVQGRISGEKKDAEESETLSHLYSRESTSITVSTTKENIVTNIYHDHDMLVIGDFSGSEPPRKLASKEEVISNEGKGKAVAVVEGIDERLPSSSRTPVSSHQPCSISGVSIMEDTRTLLDAGVFPDDIASGALDHQNVHRNMDKNMSGVGSVSDELSHKLNSEKGNDVFDEVDIGGSCEGQHIDMGQNVPGVGDANDDELAIQGRISSERKDAEESETLSHLYSRESTSITVSATKENFVTNIDQEHDMLAIEDFSDSEPPYKLASKEEVISNEGKGKVVAVVEGIDERLPSSSRTPVSSHQLSLISGVSIMEDTRTLLDAGAFPEDIASGALDRQNVRRNMDKLRPDQMVVSRDEFESLQRDRDLLRRRVATLENLLVSGHRGSIPPGLSTTLDVGWAAWSFLLIIYLIFCFFSLLFFLLFTFWLFLL